MLFQLGGGFLDTSNMKKTAQGAKLNVNNEIIWIQSRVLTLCGFISPYMFLGWLGWSLIFFAPWTVFISLLLSCLSPADSCCVSLTGPDSVGGQRHHQLQATSHPAACHPCQPVWLSYRERRGEDKGDQRGNHPPGR